MCVTHMRELHVHIEQVYRSVSMRLSVTHDKKQRDAYAHGNSIAHCVYAVLSYALRTSSPIPRDRLVMRLSITHDKKQQDAYAPQGMPLHLRDAIASSGCHCIPGMPTHYGLFSPCVW